MRKTKILGTTALLIATTITGTLIYNNGNQITQPAITIINGQEQQIEPTEWLQQQAQIEYSYEPPENVQTPAVTFQDLGYFASETTIVGPWRGKYEQTTIEYQPIIPISLNEHADAQNINRSEPTIDQNWDIQPGTASQLYTWNHLPWENTIQYNVQIGEQPSTQPHEEFKSLYLGTQNGWRIDLKNEQGETIRWFDPGEIAPYLQYNRETLTLEIDEQIKNELENKLTSFVTTGQLARFEIATTEDGREPLIENGQLVVLNQLQTRSGGSEPVLEEVWTDLQETITTQTENVTVVNREVENLEQISIEDVEELTVKLAESRTNVTGSSNRVNNVSRALSETGLTGVIVFPGECACLNQIVGPRTTEGGYLPAPFISNGELVPSVGGGVSNVATLLTQSGFIAGFDLINDPKYADTIVGQRIRLGHSIEIGTYQNNYLFGYGLDGEYDTGRGGRFLEDTVNVSGGDIGSSGSFESGWINTGNTPVLLIGYADSAFGLSLWSSEQSRFGVYEGNSVSRSGNCRHWTINRTVYDLDNEPLFSDSYNGTYRDSGALTC